MSQTCHERTRRFLLIILALLQEVFKAACASVRGREAPPDFLLAHVFTPAGAISMGTMARKLMRPQ